MKILYVTNNDMMGGAAKGAYRLHRGFLSHGIQSEMLVRRKFSNDETVRQYTIEIPEKLEKFNQRLAKEAYPGFRKQYLETSSFNIRSTRVDREINASDVDLVLMHWIGNDTLTIKEVANIKKPIIWRLADMWAICGSRHYVMDGDTRYIDGYPSVRHAADDIDAWLWARKKKYLARKEITFVCGSRWLADQVKVSRLYEGATVHVIPSSIDTSVYTPTDKVMAKRLIGVDQRKTILFCAENATDDPRKGYDLLMDALVRLQETVGRDEAQIIIFGTKQAYTSNIGQFEARSYGYLQDENLAALLYSAADVVVVPSRADNLPFTAIEALACGTPVVGFDIGGVPEIIEHRSCGFVARAFDSLELAEGIRWVLFDSDIRLLGENARARAESEYAIGVQVGRYQQLIHEQNLLVSQ